MLARLYAYCLIIFNSKTAGEMFSARNITLYQGNGRMFYRTDFETMGKMVEKVEGRSWRTEMKCRIIEKGGSER